jgi:peptidyl-prolyl cis-trans isomerase SurA
MVKEFSDASFALKNIGDLSEPFKTRYGWHIVKLIKRFPIGTFEEMKPEIDKKVQRGQRARIIGRSVIDRLLKEYNISTDHDVLKLFKSLGWRKTEEAKNNEATLLVINGNKYPAKDFIKFINRRNRKKKIEEIFQDYKEEKVLNLYKEDLPNKFPELKHTLREYREGLLLFDLMQKKIWDKADKDSVGFANFFENNRDKYQWKERVQTTIITCDKEENAKTAQKMLKEGKDTDEIKKSITTGIIDVKEKAYQKDNKVFPKDFKFQKGISNVIDDKGQFMIIEIKETLPAGPKELDETRGRAISDFQDYIEQEWIKDLRSKYPVKINKKSLKKLKKKYK